MRKRLVILMVILLALACFGSCFLTIMLPAHAQESVSIFAHKVLINEVYYASEGYDLDCEYVELYVWENVTTDLSGWYITTFDGDVGSLPGITGLGEFDYIVIRMNSGINDTDASDGRATIYLNFTEPILDNVGDEVGLYDSSDMLVDFVRYGGGNGDPVLGNWVVDDLGITANYFNESIQILGEDMDNSTNWISSPVSEGEANIFEFWAEGIDVQLRNGINADVISDVRTGEPVVKGNGINAADLKKIGEYANFSLKFFKDNNFNDPELGPDKKLDINVANGTGRMASGATYPNGSIFINLGTMPSEIDTKYVVEHELMHAIQLKKFHDADGEFVRFPPPSQWFFSEGMATYWGIRSVKENFNKTDKEIQDEFERVQDHNVYDDFKNPNINLFDSATSWQQKTRAVYNWYIGSYLFFKFIAEKYGENRTREIQGKIKNYGRSWEIDPKDKLAYDVLKEVLGKSLEDLIKEWMVWLFKDAPSKNQVPPRQSTETPFKGAPITEAGTLQPWGTKFENITVNTDKPFEIHFKSKDPNSKFTIIILKIKKDGTVIEETLTVCVPKKIDNPTEYNKIVVIKTRINATGTGEYTLGVSIPPSSPKADFKPTPETPHPYQTVRFDASASLPGSNGTHSMPITEYRWDFGDGNQTTTFTPIVYHSFTNPGIYYPTLTVCAPGALPEIDSTTYRITVISVSVGGYSFAIKGYSTENPLTLYMTLITILVAVSTVISVRRALGFVSCILFGVMNGFLFLKTRTIYGCIASHSALNRFALLLNHLVQVST